MWFANYFRKRAREKDIAAERAEAKLLQQKNDVLELVRKAESKMLSKPCKLSPDGPTCSDICAHFKAGKVWLFMGDALFPAQWIDVMPRCKLWRE